MSSTEGISPTSPTSAPNSTSSSSTDTPNPGDASSNLYLFTFLATLLVLLVVSTSIVLRSFFLRRRFRARVDAARAAGIMLAPPRQGSRRRRFGAKPKLYDAWITDGGFTWDEMMPVSALPVKSKRRSKEEHSPYSKQATSGGLSEQSSSRTIISLLESWGYHIGRSSKPSLPPSLPQGPTEPRAKMLQVSVLVAMPSPRRSQNSSTSSLGHTEDEVPEVMFGVTRLPYKADLDLDQ